MAENGAATACASDLRSSHRSLWSKPRTGRVVQAETVDETLQAAVDLCVELIDGCNVANDLRDDQRWPGFARHAIELGVTSVVCFQLFLHRDNTDRFGALNLYGAGPDAFNERALEIGAVFAAHCTTTLATAITQEGLEAALPRGS